MNAWLIAAPAAVVTLATGFTAYGAAYPRAQLFGPTICRTNSPRQLSLTFDDGPNPAITPKLMDLLDRYDARATFFLVGRFVRECPDLAREIAARGHVIGNHTDTHPNLFYCGASATRDQLLRCSAAIASATGAAPNWFRPPFGMRSPWLVDIAREIGLPVVMWTLLPGDWRGKPAEWLIPRLQPIASNAQRNLAHPSAPTGDILCLHDGDYSHQNGDRTHTLAALEYWLPRWRDLGLEFVTIEQAVRTPAS
jgi:peptidoglycan/xylan/chitin deacetylase (PgdA/CDA1 family)